MTTGFDGQSWLIPDSEIVEKTPRDHLTIIGETKISVRVQNVPPKDVFKSIEDVASISLTSDKFPIVIKERKGGKFIWSHIQPVIAQKIINMSGYLVSQKEGVIEVDLDYKAQI